MAEVKEPVTTPPRKYSRYRSVRQQAEAEAEADAAAALVEPEKNGEHTVSRSMSRYRRPKKLDSVTSPPMPTSPIPQANHESPTKAGERRVRGPASEKQQLPTRYPTVAETEAERQQRKGRETQELEHLKKQPRQEPNRLLEAYSKVEVVRRTEEEVARVLAEQKRKDLERLEAELEAAAPTRALSPKTEKFGFFSRKRAATKSSAVSSAVSGSRSTSAKTTVVRSNDSPPRGSHEPPARGLIEKGGGGIVPGTDAPMSASNAGERRVLIRFKQSSINLPVTPETTPADLIYSAANIMSQNISPAAAILLESYTKLGLERRIRRYEHIRDIMNSWDRDTQNALILQNSDSPKSDTDLETSSVPRTAPKDIQVFLYHSQKPGKWNKRYVTLLKSGQIFMSKKKEANSTEKDSVNLCHLSDFDIYTPTAQQIRKNIKPPKQHCYAIKSQHRTNMFLSTENFVHFFSTDMEEIAELWYKAVQAWRSWYLVNKMGEGKKETKNQETELRTKGPGTGHKLQVSVDEDPYTIGSFKPLINNMDLFSSKSGLDYDSDEENRHRQIPFHLRNDISPERAESKRHPPPVSYRLPPEAEEEFSNSGLLGRTYSLRAQEAKARQAVDKEFLQPFTNVPSLVAGPGHRRTNSVKSTRTVAPTTGRPQTSAGPGLQRHATTREKPKPLLDFTPQFKEPPQWDRTGKGHGVQAVAGIPLVEVATTLENPLADLASTTVFRRPATSYATAAKEGPFVQGGLVSGI